MATYAELFDLLTNSALRNKVKIAVVTKAQSLIDFSTPTANQIKWADNALRDTEGTTSRLFPYVLAANAGATAAAIAAASDSQILAGVSAAADKFILQGLV